MVGRRANIMEKITVSTKINISSKLGMMLDQNNIPYIKTPV